MKWLLFISLFIILIWTNNRIGESRFIILGANDTIINPTYKRDSLHISKMIIIKSSGKDTVTRDSLVKKKYPYGIPRGLFLRGIEL